MTRRLALPCALFLACLAGCSGQRVDTVNSANAKTVASQPVRDQAITGKWVSGSSPSIGPKLTFSPRMQAELDNYQAMHPLDLRNDHTFTWPGIGSGTWVIEANRLRMVVKKSAAGKLPPILFLDVSPDGKSLGLGQMKRGPYAGRYMESFTKETWPPHLKAVPAVPKGDKEKAKQVLAKMDHAYATLRTYSDYGYVRAGNDEVGFETHFKSPDKLYFEFKEVRPLAKLRSVLWRTGAERQLPGLGGRSQHGLLGNAYFESKKQGFHDWSLDELIAQFQGISLGSASTIPSLLLPQGHFFYHFHPSGDTVVTGFETFEGSKCFVLHSEKDSLTLWIDAKSFALLKSEDYSFGSHQVTVYTPTLNLPVQDVVFAYKPPKASP